MEKQIFSWHSWGHLDVLSLAFYDCQLECNVGSLLVGSIIPRIDMNYQEGTMTIYLDDDSKEVFDLELLVKSKEGNSASDQPLCPPSIFTQLPQPLFN